MKFSVNRAVFVENLSNVQRAISSRTTIPVLTGVKILATDNGILLTGSDSTISIEAFIDANNEDNQLQVEKAGSIVLPSRFFGEIVKKLPNEIMHLEVKDNLQTDITAGQAAFTLNGTAGSEYPKLPEIDSDTSFTLPANIFRQVVNHTIISVSNQEIRPIFTGIHFVIADDHLKAVSTDSHRLSQRIVPLEVPEGLADQEFALNIPGRSLSELTRIAEDSDNIEMMVADKQVLFKTDNIYLYSRLLEGKYPDTDRLLPEDYQTRIQIDAPDLLSAIERALILSHEGRNNVVKLTIDSDQVVLSGQSAEVGEVEEELNIASADGESLAISFNPDYMRQALRTFGAQEIALRFQSPSHQFILLPANAQDNFNFVQLITPIRTPGN
ncbi:MULTISPECIES: DNA polymerase III subunit beta [Aerococcus]|uniref:Beta sliding clamp n=1 Tax=Aerococcus sanguinicola TaxID=119206 RepID=A0A5N1GK12_9LACT|nr:MULTISPECIES: DNA polymerase III subunit beta [Aerococcus]KAA9301142.1 DNA polymerase III subunit beta [Aerococcus sanguinicola]MDK6369330.1 DNA polymerase III subunit beta [Aerococcus sp. UMB9870]MDK6679155.1 DNA polymerase III subunit beta [Aerococcus sp. UMB8608]MDK6687160.1 DNA polymerase III subunit beta [Aerococcus sp. UMB8623]MDK6941116.1 DNA polymerase III subunit beta [Aerococcus sp. UMB8487]